MRVYRDTFIPCLRSQRGSAVIEYAALILLIVGIAFASVGVNGRTVAAMFLRDTGQMRNQKSLDAQPSAAPPSQIATLADVPLDQKYISAGASEVKGRNDNVVDIDSDVCSQGFVDKLSRKTEKISISGDPSAVFQIDHGPWITSGSVRPGQTVTTCLHSSSDYSKKSKSTIKVGKDHWVFVIQTRPVPDTNPNIFNFVDTAYALPDKMYYSSVVLMSGIDRNSSKTGGGGSYYAPVTITGDSTAEFQINGTSGWETSGLIRNGDTLQLRMKAPSALLAASRAYVSVSDVSAIWLVSTDQNVGTIIFPSQTLPWDTTLTQVKSGYVDIPGIGATPTPFTVTGSGSPFLDTNVVSGSDTEGSLVKGTEMVINVPAPGQTNIGSLNISGQTANFIVSRDPLPPIGPFRFKNETFSTSGRATTEYITFQNLGNYPRPFSVVGDGNPAVVGGGVVSGTPQKGMLVQGAAISADIPPSGQTYTITFTLDGVSDSFTFKRNGGPK